MLLLVQILIILLCALVISIELKKWYLNCTKLKSFNQLRGIPFFGPSYKFIGKKNFDFLTIVTEIFSQQFSNESPKYTWIFDNLVIGIDNPADAQVILNSDKCLDKPFVYEYIGPKTGIFLAKKDVWKKNRRALNPSLSPKMIANEFMPIFNKKFKITANQMEQYVGQYIDLHKPMFKASAEAILATQFDLDWPLQTKRGDEIYEFLDEWFECVQWRFVRFYLRWDFVYKFTKHFKREQNAREQLFQFIYSSYEVKKIELADKLDRGEDVLQKRKEQNHMKYIEKCLLLEREKKISFQNMRDELQTVFVGATDTSSTVLSTVILLLAIHQDYQEKVVAELHEVFEHVDDLVSYEDVAKLNYLEIIVKESLRLFPVGPILARVADADLQLRNGIVPKGAMLLFNNLKLHRDPKYWGENAHLFYPERFLTENYANIHPYAFLGFSAGPRNCIGVKYAWCSLKVLLVYLLRRYKFTTHLKLKDVRIKATLALKIDNEKPVRIDHREW